MSRSGCLVLSSFKAAGIKVFHLSSGSTKNPVRLTCCLFWAYEWRKEEVDKILNVSIKKRMILAADLFAICALFELECSILLNFKEYFEL
jgi:hypothetical protein